MKSTDETPQNNHLRLPCGLFLLALESNELHGIEVDSEQCVVDRGGQITLIPALRAKQFVQADQQTNVEDIETGVSTDCHRLHQHPSRVPAVALPQRSIPYDVYMTLMYASTRVRGKHLFTYLPPCRRGAGGRTFHHCCFPPVRTSSS